MKFKVGDILVNKEFKEWNLKQIQSITRDVYYGYTVTFIDRYIEEPLYLSQEYTEKEYELAPKAIQVIYG